MICVIDDMLFSFRIAGKLLLKCFLIFFESGIRVTKSWRVLGMKAD